jgi:tetratricopeptide (TPR) repeat protein
MKQYIDKRLENAYDLLLEGNLKEAVVEFEAHLKENPESIHLLMELANIYYILGEMGRSIGCYRKVLELKPDSAYVLYRMGVALYRSTLFTEATFVFNKIIDSGKYLPMTYLWLGLSYYHLGKEEKSIEAYRKLLEFCPETQMANYYMGVSLKSAGKYDDAIIHFERLLGSCATCDQHVSALYHLGRTYMKKFNYDMAKIQFKKAMELDPDNKNASEMYDYLMDL